MDAGVVADTAAYRSEPAPRRSVMSWAVYDLGSTIFSLMIISLHFPLWVVDDQGGADAHFTLAVSASMLLMLLAAPVLGAYSDGAPRRKPFMIVFTLICIGLTALLGSTSLYPALAIFILANFAFQAGLLFYDTLLPSVSTPSNRGRVSGLGVGIGYFGSIIAIFLALTIIGLGGTEARVWVFRLAAALFLIFAIPAFLYVREPARKVSPVAAGRKIRNSVDNAWRGVKSLRQQRELRLFLGSHFLYADAANTAIAVLGIYATNEVGFSDEQAQLVLLAGVVGAIVGGFTVGRLVDRYGPRNTLMGVLAVWVVSLMFVAVIAWLELPSSLFWLVAVLVGVALGGLWTSDRPLMLQLAPPARLGEFYGIYSMVGRFAAVIGPLLWAIIVTGLGWGRPVAVAGLAIFVAAAMVMLAEVPNRFGQADTGAVQNQPMWEDRQ